VITDVATYHTHVVILATGTIDKKLNIPGEDDFLGRGVSFCAECDGGFFQDQDVAVIGDSAYALREVIHLSTLAQRVYWIQSFPLSQASPLLRDDRVTILAQALPIRINGEQAVQSLVVDVQGTSQTLSVAAVFPCLGVVPHTAMIRDLQVCADDQSVVTGQNYQTPLNGLFAIGDVKQQSSYRLQSALEDGKNVMKHIQTYLKNKSN
jgi:thioredoxin reductase (NADPH)